ncbi:NAD-dependent epimerase/dehydratase family protein [bacterium]|nr:NAD-dependent epimerase/dehydratase family protein [bacterium]
MSTTPNTLKKPFVLITGAAGRIGRALTEHLASDFSVIGMDVDDPPDGSDADVWIHCDLTSDESVAAAFSQVKSLKAEEAGSLPKLAAVVHLAAYYDFSGEPSDLYEELTVRGTRRMLEHLESLPVEQFIFTSSLLVMKPDDEHKLHEWDPVNAEWEYPQSKVRAERVIREHAGEIPCVILRVAGVYDDVCHSIPLSQQVARIYEKRMTSFVFPGDKTHGQAMIHMDDLVACIQCVIDSRNKLSPREMFLIAEPDVMSYAELQDQLGSLIHGKWWPTIWIPKPLAKVGAWLQGHLTDADDGPFIRPWMVDLADDNYEVDLTHARNALHWEPMRRLRYTLPLMIGRFHADPKAWYEEHDLEFPESVDFGNWKPTGLQATPY